MVTIKRLKVKYLLLIFALTIYISDYFGVFLFIRQTSFDQDFSYPYHGNIEQFVTQLKSGNTPSVAPLYSHDYFLFHSSTTRCLSSDETHLEKLRLLYLVKSAAANKDKRDAIRKTWGQETRFSDVPLRTVFLLGHVPQDAALQGRIELEQREHGDLVQGNFQDSYFNNTIKTAMGLKWAVEHCGKSRFFMFVDDDYYVSTRNVLRFLRNPLNYPEYLQQDVISFDEEEQRARIKQRHLNQLVDFDLPDSVRLYTGYVFPSARPHRHRSSKWYVPLQEYPFSHWPAYVTAGAYVLSREALLDMYFTSYYTQMFRFDDIWLGLIARKAEIEPLHSKEFYFYPKPYTVLGYKYTIASHGYSNPEELVRVWNEQKMAGHA